MWFHKIQPPFLLTSDFFQSYSKVPGGLSEWFGNFVMQAFYYPIKGSILFYLVAIITSAMVFVLLQRFKANSMNKILAIMPLILIVTLAGNYSFPFSTIVSLILVALLLLPFQKINNQIYFLIYFLISAIIVFYISGNGFLGLFSVSAVFIVLKQRNKVKKLNLVYIGLLSFLIIWIGNNFIFSSAENKGYFQFFGLKENIDYEPNIIFYLYMFCIPVLMAFTQIVEYFKKKNRNKTVPIWLKYVLVLVVLLAGFASHKLSFDSDSKKIVESDYYCYRNDVNKTVKAAMSTEKYDFSANINYNLSIMKAGKLTRDYFNFFQMSGTDGLYPDKRFPSKMTLISTDFYYELGDIQEAKYWALESFKKNPYNRRVLQKLVKIEIITGNFNEAKKYLNILDAEFFNHEFVRKYNSYFSDTTLINADEEIIQKRSFIPGFTEVPETPLKRFEGLLDANPGNKTAFECMMLYYMLSGDLEHFAGLYGETVNYFKNSVDVYEEAILMYGAINSLSVAEDYNISVVNINRLKKFADELKKRGDKDRVAMNEMFDEFGDSYFFYYYFILPQIAIPDYAGEELKTNKEKEDVLN